MKPLVTILLFLLSACSGVSRDIDHGGDSTASDGPKLLSKAAEMSQARGGPSATQVSGNPDKWLGSYVQIRCRITNVIHVGDGSDEANAMCGRGIDAAKNAFDASNVDYSDPDAVNRALERQNADMKKTLADAQDQALIVLSGDRVSQFDGGQELTIIGPVLGGVEGKNGMGVSTTFPTVRVDYAE